MIRSLFDKKVRELYPMHWYQEPAIPMFRAAVKEGNRKIVGQAPCGYGKTVIAAHLASSSMKKGNRVLFACPRISLVDQTLESFEAQGIHDIGIMQANHKRTDPSCKLQIACFDTLYSREVPDFDFVILDEIHLADARMWKLMERWKIVLALTATPWKKGLGLHFSKLIVLSTINDMLEYHEKDPSLGLVPIKGIGPKLEFLREIEHLKTGQDGDIQENAAAHFMEKTEVIADIVDTWLRTRQEGNHPGDRTFVFARRRITALAYQEAFRAQGIKFDYIDAFTSHRSPIFERFRRRESQGIVSVGCLSTGVDEDVRCIVSAAPRKNQADIVQELGRGLRPAEGKEYCIARDSLVLTPHGLVKIQDITLDHLVWDGVNWVHHKGAVCKGVKPVIEYDGIIATPDHEVMTNDGFQRLADAQRRQIGIVTTGVGGNPVRFSGDSFTKNGRLQLSSVSRGWMPQLRENPHGAFLQYEETSRYSGLSSLQPQEAGARSDVALPPLPTSDGEMPEPFMPVFSSIRWERNQVSVCQRERCGSVDRGQLGDCGSFIPDRQDKERRALRARESSLGVSDQADEQYNQSGRNKEAEDYRFQSELPSRSICGPHPESPHVLGTNGRRDSETMGNTIIQAEREVWDILSAGPLQRFTVNGKLVHNCWLNDHVGNANRYGWFADIFHDKLDTTPPHVKGSAYEKDEAAPQEVKRKQCPVCREYLPRGAFKCKTCGNQIVVDDTVTLDGELVDLRQSKAAKKAKKELAEKEKAARAEKKKQGEPQAFYSGLLDFAERRGFKEGWAANKFREKYGIWPDKLRKVPMTPRKAVKEFIAEWGRKWREQQKQMAASKPAAQPEYQGEW